MGAGEADGGKRGWWGQARRVGAGEAGGGRRGWWGQARLVGAGEANGGRKPPGQIPSQHVHSAGSIQLNSISATAYVQCSTIEYIH